MIPRAVPHLDPLALERLRRWGGRSLLERVASSFLTHAPVRVAALAGAARGGDRESARANAHALVSSAGQIGALRLSRLAAEIEAQAKGDATLAALVDELEREIWKVTRLLMQMD